MQRAAVRTQALFGGKSAAPKAKKAAASKPAPSKGGKSVGGWFGSVEDRSLEKW